MRIPQALSWAIIPSAALTWAAITVATGIVIQVSSTTEAFARSRHFCENYAHDYAVRRARRGVIGDTARGAATLGVIGGITNGRRGAQRGAAIGAGVGAIAGGSARRGSYYFYFDRAFARCIRR